MSDDFAKYIDDMVLALADGQSGTNLVAIDLNVIHHRDFPDTPPTWLQLAAPELTRLGYGDLAWDAGNSRAFLINGAGVIRAAQIREDRRSKSIWEKIKSVPRSDWIAIGAFIVSLIALLKD
jgi:hypothetical protein